MTSISNDITNLFFDGRQKITFSINDLNSFFNIPELKYFDYNMGYLHGYRKVLRYRFPNGYRVVDSSVRNIKRENNYISVEFSIVKISDNEIEATFELKLKDRMIRSTDFPIISRFIETVNNEVDFYLTFQNTDDFDYDSYFDKLSEIYSSVEVYENWIRKLMENSRSERVIEVATEAIDRFPEREYFYLIKSSLLIDKGDFIQAESVLLDLIGRDQTTINPYMYLSEIYKKLENNSKNLEILLIAFDRFPGNKSVLLELSNYYVRIKDYEQSISTLKDGLNNYPNDPEILHDIGFVYSLIPDFERAEEFYLLGLEASPRNAIICNNLAWLYCENNTNLLRAIELSERACSIEPLNDTFLDTLAEAYYLNGEYEKAIFFIRKAISISPNNSYFQQQLNKMESGLNNQ